MTDFSMLFSVDEIADELGRLDYIGLDTEFMREKTFFAELSLVQISTGDAIWCADPLSDLDTQRFWPVALDCGWVVHSARQDIEVIYQAAGQMPARLFDTQVAAGLLGYAPQLGYAGLVSELFDVEIPKTHTRADWSRRPLRPELLQYAAEDVEYLLPAKDILVERLDKLGRLSWVEEDSALLLDPALYEPETDAAIKRLKAARNLRGRRRSAAARLAAWREAEAARANRPRQWIAKDGVLMEIALRLPQSIADLEKIPELPAGLLRRSGKRLLEEVAASAGDEPLQGGQGAPDEAQKALLKQMQKKVASCAAELDLSPEIIAPKKELSAVVIGGGRDSRVFSGWRRDLIGDTLLQML